MSNQSDLCDVELLAVAALSLDGGVPTFINRGGFRSSATKLATGSIQLTLRDDHHADHLVVAATLNGATAAAGSIQGAGGATGSSKTDKVVISTFDDTGAAADLDFSIVVYRAK